MPSGVWCKPFYFFLTMSDQKEFRGLRVDNGIDKDGNPYVWIGAINPETDGSKITRYCRFRSIKELLKAYGLYEDVLSRVRAKVIGAPVEEPKLLGLTEELKKKASPYAAAYAKAFNKEVYTLLGLPSKKFLGIVNGKFYEAFVKDIPKKVRSNFCIDFSGKPCHKMVEVINSIYPLMKETYDDGNMHILPFVIAFKKTPAELRKAFGKGLWKTIANNTLHRNKIWVNYVRRNRPSDRCISSTIISAAKASRFIPTTLLKYASTSPYSLPYLALHCKGSWSNARLMYSQINNFEGVERMLRHLDREYDGKRLLKMSPQRLSEEHERLVVLVNAKKASDANFQWLKTSSLTSFGYDGYEVELLDSELKIVEEGQAMHHCVAAYSSSCARGEYVVFSVKKDGKRYRTLGMHRSLEGLLRFNQHYKSCNAEVDCEIAKQIPYYIIQTF